MLSDSNAGVISTEVSYMYVPSQVRGTSFIHMAWEPLWTFHYSSLLLYFIFTLDTLALDIFFHVQPFINVFMFSLCVYV